MISKNSLNSSLPCSCIGQKEGARREGERKGEEEEGREGRTEGDARRRGRTEGDGKEGGRELVDYNIKDKGRTVKEVITITEPFIIHQLVLFAIQYSKFIVGY